MDFEEKIEGLWTGYTKGEQIWIFAPCCELTILVDFLTDLLPSVCVKGITRQYKNKTAYIYDPLSNLLSIVLLVGVPSNSVFRHTQNVACGPLVKSCNPLRCYSTHRSNFSHINLKPVCSRTSFSFRGPSSCTPSIIESGVVWVVLCTVVAAGCHLSIWNPVRICHAYRLTTCKKVIVIIIIYRFSQG